MNGALNPIRAALGKYVRMPDRLAESPLLLSRIVRDQADEAVPQRSKRGGGQ